MWVTKYYSFTDVVTLYFINYLIDTQLKILKYMYPIGNYDDELWYPTDNANTQFIKKSGGYIQCLH